MKKMTKVLVVMMAVLIVFGGVIIQAADQSWEEIKDKGEIVVGLCAAYPPFESRNENTGEFEGFDIDLAKALGEELEIDVKIVDAEWQALLGGLMIGDYDILITCMSKKEASIENVNMSDVYYKLTNNIVIRKDNDSIQSVSDLEAKVVGVQLGSGSEQLVDQLTGLKDIRRYNYNPEAFIDLKNKRIDAVVVGYAYAVNQLPKHPNLKIVDEPLDSADIVMVMKNGKDKLTTKINAALAAIKEDGTYDQLIQKWLTVEQ